MTDGKDETWSPDELSSEEAAMVSGGRLFHARAAATRNAWSPRVDRRVAPASSESRQSADGNEQQPLMMLFADEWMTSFVVHLKTCRFLFDYISGVSRAICMFFFVPMETGEKYSTVYTLNDSIIWYRVVHKNAHSLMQRHSATVCSRITGFSAKCSEINW